MTLVIVLVGATTVNSSPLPRYLWALFPKPILHMVLGLVKEMQAVCVWGGGAGAPAKTHCPPPHRILTPLQTHYPLGETVFILGEVTCEGVNVFAAGEQCCSRGG